MFLALASLALAAGCNEGHRDDGSLAPPHDDPLGISVSDFPDRTFSGNGVFEIDSSYPFVQLNVNTGVSSAQGFLGAFRSLSAAQMKALVEGERAFFSDGSAVGLGDPVGGVHRPFESAELAFDQAHRTAVLTLYLGEAYGGGVLDDGRTADDLAATGFIRIEGVFGVGCAVADDASTVMADPTWSSSFCQDALETYSLGILRDFFAGD